SRIDGSITGGLARYDGNGGPLERGEWLPPWTGREGAALPKRPVGADEHQVRSPADSPVLKGIVEHRDIGTQNRGSRDATDAVCVSHHDGRRVQELVNPRLVVAI